ncbi:BlaI/MecI/CopY family transcriptional regulator, partial [Streptomyces inhibens]|uniref:BlaI/MecI/CopY family transcriptional regulator n=1 Tax=Streptomyces inhibens TaxID=2293571 RepID=UPI003675756D
GDQRMGDRPPDAGAGAGDPRPPPAAARAPPHDELAVAKAKRHSGTGVTAQRSTPSTAAPTKTKAKSGAKSKAQQPLLGDLLMELLTRHDEPRPAKELRDELREKHPSRNPTPQVVRNTLESLVAKGRIQRHKQQRSVMYTLVKSATAR